MTGGWIGGGPAQRAAGIRFVAAVEDTRLEPALALEKAKALRERGAQLLIGPQSSAEVAHLKPFVDSAGILLVSPASTAGTLAIAGDNIFLGVGEDELGEPEGPMPLWRIGPLRFFARGYRVSRFAVPPVNSSTAISGRAPSRMGKLIVPMPQLTYTCESRC